MTDQQLYCDGPGRDPGTECGVEVAGHGGGETGTPKCQAHLKQLQRDGRMKPIAEKLTPIERCLVAGSAWVEADSDDDQEAKRLERIFVAACMALKAKGAPESSIEEIRKTVIAERAEAIRKGLERARARGVRLGRPPKVDVDELTRLLGLRLSVAAVARELRLGIRTVYRYARKKGFGSPRPGGESS